MTGPRAHARDERRLKTRVLQALAMLCLVLVALLAVAQVAHVHASDNCADHCSLCVSMHSLVPIGIMLVTIIMVRLGNATPLLCASRVVIQFWPPSLFTRPPPAA